MLSVNRQGFQGDSSPWADGAASLQSEMLKWYESFESTLALGTYCNLSLWSNDFYLLAAIVSFTVSGNADDELVIEVAFHRSSPGEKDVDLTAEICRESGPPLAVMAVRKLPLDASGSLSNIHFETAIASIRSFLIVRSPLVAEQLSAIAERR